MKYVWYSVHLTWWWVWSPASRPPAPAWWSARGSPCPESRAPSPAGWHSKIFFQSYKYFFLPAAWCRPRVATRGRWGAAAGCRGRGCRRGGGRPGPIRGEYCGHSANHSSPCRPRSSGGATRAPGGRTPGSSGRGRRRGSRGAGWRAPPSWQL